ncbi:MAG: glycyl-radical enzyme activating protein [Bacteroidetes bacterium]|nr:glycyl-radical enzyme activating protein [Bacteroidota bacterium]MBU1720208.1 glycyl-radical enzyme activating protein [Bacteroidota bacterium]
MQKCLITKIVKDSILDGPGCRYVTFVKGCNLNCPWCHNPETKSSKQEVFTYSRFCIHCGNCVNALSADAQLEVTPVEIDNSNSEQYFNAVEACPTKTLEYASSEYSTDEIIDDMRKYSIMYSKTKGGLTISGGDPLFVADFSFELFTKAKAAGFHTAADTALSFKWDIVEKFLPVVDMWLIDLKHIDDNNLKTDLTIANLLKLANISGSKIWIRIPIVPGYNDNEAIWEAMATLLNDAGNAIEQVSLLPFHPFGTAKYEALRIDYPFSGVKHLDDSVIDNATEIFSKHLRPEILTKGRRILHG